MNNLLYINEETVTKLLNWDSTFKAIEIALECTAKNRAIQSPRTFTKCPKTDSILLTMPGYLDNDAFGALGCKLVTATPNNATLPQPLPTINAHIMLFDDVTGVLKAVIAGTEITKWRTAAASAVATKYLTRGKKLKVLAILGAGNQGHSHALAFSHFFPFEEIRIWNRNKYKAETLVRALNLFANTGKFKCYESNKECVTGADVIVTATFAAQPIVERDWLKPGVHINAIGAGVNHYSELSPDIYNTSDVYVDHAEGAKVELAGLGVKLGEIGGVIAGDLPPPTLNQVTVFQSLGMAVEDCAMARLIYDLYVKQCQKE
ncbi:Ketimine reductase mu-crystallin-like Protein [Tribolium castaneum]|uniref:Ketimine reductase mu-crystallin n=1 Tax=Tribolium castaneum TaxID=7070 RepID=D6WWE5_TRICA|nr:PREDICTED: ketimine reductase mu-crystallin [Tribolium castaneum]EFA08703.1 Ketimine reductase mu-crystallin-like Protein [Tribolium castaneum]|eukprot:XP_973576.1 PREDICTED: ketimine reductase mu-crystallin [Tribolium castaneum]